ncbi:MAG TPA: flagellar basal body-associated protein FliL [Eoetvoesiella sp.]
MAKSKNDTTATVLKTLLLAMIIAAASVGATLFYTSKAGTVASSAANAAPPAPPPIPNPIFVPLEPFTVTLGDQHASRILFVDITLRVIDEQSRQQITTYMPEVRNRVLTVLTKQTPADIQTPDGRAQLAQTLSETLKSPYSPQPSGPQISKVLFTAFVVQ